jgi:hypothetical protein
MMQREIIQHLINLDLPLQEIRSQLNTLSWDSDVEVSMTKNAAKLVPERYINGGIGSETLVAWASIMEGRYDICFEPSCSKDLKQLVFELANPEMQGLIDKDKDKAWLLKFK